jgi:hypothetical protein
LITANKFSKVLILTALLITTTLTFAQNPNAGGDPTGFSTPIDGGILMALLAGGGLVAMLFKKKKDKE